MFFPVDKAILHILSHLVFNVSEMDDDGSIQHLSCKLVLQSASAYIASFNAYTLWFLTYTKKVCLIVVLHAQIFFYFL